MATAETPSASTGVALNSAISASWELTSAGYSPVRRNGQWSAGMDCAEIPCEGARDRLPTMNPRTRRFITLAVLFGLVALVLVASLVS